MRRNLSNGGNYADEVKKQAFSARFDTNCCVGDKQTLQAPHSVCRTKIIESILSWHNQPQDKKLYEAGSYGYRLGVNIPQKALELARTTGELIIRLEVDESLAGGLAIYGDKFGRYPMNPTVVLVVE